jgi:hypothetical protein
MDSSLRDELNKSLDDRFSRTTAYKSVSVLVVYWSDCTDIGYKREAQIVGELFSVTFGFVVDYYEIPTNDSCELELDVRISNFLLHNRDPNRLLIIHYGGHGNPDDERGQKKESVWCA